MTDDCTSASSLLSAPSFSLPEVPPVLVHNKFVIAPPIDHFRRAPTARLLSDSLDLTDCPKCNNIMLPALYCDHCRVQYVARSSPSFNVKV
jgi:hypothetical protein